MESPQAFGSAFPEGLESWASWVVALKAIYGLEMGPEELAVFQALTGRQTPNADGYAEAYFVVGRRGGKSRITATIAAYEAIFGGWESRLSPGERAWIFIIATDRSQAGVVMGYVKSLVSLYPDLIEREAVEELHLSNHISIAVKSCGYRGTRGFSTAIVILDELAFWRDENSANPASEVIISLLPGLMPGANLLGISTAYAKFGLLYEMHKAHFGKDSDILVWQAPTSAMNPTYDQRIINRLVARDPAVFGPEYAGTFREDVSNFLPESLVRAAMTRQLLFPDPRIRYTAFCDPSGGRQDSMTLAICHRDGEKVLLDRIEERKAPFDPAGVVTEFAGILKSYGCHSVTSDRFGGAWVEESFRKQGIRLEMSDQSASDLYLEFQPLLSMGRVELIEDERLALQLTALERRARSGGRDLVDHPAGGHDDVANGVAGAVVHAARGTVWDEKVIEAHLPQTNRSSPLGAASERYEEMEEELRRFLGPGTNRIIRQ